MLDEQGYRLNVGIILANEAGELLWCRRVNVTDAWQFPQGGIHDNESSIDAMYRELKEELGLSRDDVKLIAQTNDWLSYELPERYRRYDTKPLCIGQKQQWFLLRLLSDDSSIRLDGAEKPEFNSWRWVEYWWPLEEIIEFKRDVYRKVLEEFEGRL